MTDFNVAGVVLPYAQSDSLEAKALAYLGYYLRRAPERTEAEEVIARDAFVQGVKVGYRLGGREATESWTELNTLLCDRRIQTALAVLLRFVDESAERTHG